MALACLTKAFTTGFVEGAQVGVALVGLWGLGFWVVEGPGLAGRSCGVWFGR